MAINNSSKHHASSKIRNILTIKSNSNPNAIRSGVSDSILASMFRTIMEEIGINETRWNHLMTDYVLDKNNCIPNNNKDQSSARGNLQKELLKNKMSWKVFCKGIRFLNIIKFDFIIRAHHPNGKITEHTKTVSFGDIVKESQNDEQDK